MPSISSKRLASDILLISSKRSTLALTIPVNKKVKRAKVTVVEGLSKMVNKIKESRLLR